MRAEYRGSHRRAIGFITAAFTATAVCCSVWPTGNAPALLNVDKRGVPVRLHFGFRRRDCVVRAAQYGSRVRIRTADGAGGLRAVVINWAMISLAHMMFHARAAAGREKPASRPCYFYPFGNVLCLLFMAAVLIDMLMMGAVWRSPLWLIRYGGCSSGVGYLCKEKRQKR